MMIGLDSEIRTKGMALAGWMHMVGAPLCHQIIIKGEK